MRERFPQERTQLERYAAVLNAVEINSSFYRPHRRTTYIRWKDSVPAGFRFALKVPREITHVRRLAECAEPLDRFLDESSGLGEKRGVLLIQLPPSFAFDEELVRKFFRELRDRYDGGLACEPRHPAWFSTQAEALLRDVRIARVAADPSVVPEAIKPGGWDGLAYYRLHGSPRTYYSAYEDARLERFSSLLGHEATVRRAWCIFDNTAMGAALPNALTLRSLLAENGSG